MDEIDTKSDEIIHLGDFWASLKTKELQSGNGEIVPLRSQSTGGLALLAATPGQLVAKETLIEIVWADTFVTDDSLVQCIGDIRKALGDTDRKIVETVPKKGYRLNAPNGGVARRGSLAVVLGWLAVAIVFVVVA
ncbi:transcriptional regulator [Yoonia sp. SS1-5]|uniref:Transcriptional regulator n=1 Tax=Yoonia rhodophyticola TaxID=3137370 RepID=A0AAN0M9F1_9RHOB